MSNSDLDGKTVVMAWEHHHIADAKLEKEFPDAPVTLRQLDASKNPRPISRLM